MEGVQELIGLEPKEKKELGLAKLSCFEFISANDPMHNARALFDGMGGLTRMIDGKYVRLVVDGELMMSDTRMEKVTNTEFIRNANGRVFIAGLGVGLILHNLKPKIESGVVKEIVVMEKYQDVIDLISPYYKDLPIKYVVADVLEYKPTKEDVFDTIYFDIWATICEDNLDEISMLHNRWKFKKRKGNTDAWMGSWMQDFLRAERRRYSY